MAQEIYHRSEWGNPNEQWGNVYLNADLTNELYKRASEYENSWVTDQLLNGVGTKPSIILTPTAYDDGKLLSVKPAKTFGSELVTNGTFDIDSNWTLTQATIEDGKLLLSTSDGSYTAATQSLGTTGRLYRITLDVSDIIGIISVAIGGGTDVNITTNGTHTFELTSTSTTFEVKRKFGITNVSATIDNVSVKEVIDADFDFTRGSSATRVNEQGLIQDVQILSGELVQNGDFEQIGSELVTNGDFSTSGTPNTSSWSLGWYSNTNNVIISDGKLTMTNSASESDARVYATNGTSSNNILTTNKFYKLQYDIVSNNGVTDFRYYSEAGAFISVPSVEVGSYTIYIRNTSNSLFLFQNRTSNSSISIDNISVKEVGQNWEFGTGWSIEDGKAVFDDVTTYFFSQTGLSIISGKKYKIGFTIADCPTTAHMTVYDSGGSDLILANENYVNGSYVRYYTATTNESGISFWGNTVGDTFSITNISVIEITDDTDLPRINYTNFDYKDGEVVPYSGEGSLLLEPQRTNLITDYTGAGFSVFNGASITANDSTSPDGSANATLITTTGTANQLIQQASISISSGQSYTISGYFKLKSGTLSNSNNAFKGLDGFNGGGITGSTFNSTLTNEWQRLSFNVTSSTTSGRVQIKCEDAAQILIWGLQVELGSYATSIIKTTSAAVTRLADVCNNSGSSDLINSTEGVLYAEISALANDLTNRAICISKDGTLDNIIVIQYNSVSQNIRFLYRQGAVSVADLNFALNDITQFHKVAGYWKQNEFKLFINGAKVEEQLSGNVSANNVFKTLNFNRPDGQNFYGKCKTVAVFKEALSDTELAKLTQV